MQDGLEDKKTLLSCRLKAKVAEDGGVQELYKVGMWGAGGRDSAW